MKSVLELFIETSKHYKEDVPIGSENGVRYYMVDGYRLSPVSLTKEKINALITSEKFIKQQGDISLSKNFDSMLFKIKSVLKNSQKEDVQVIEVRTRNSVAGTIHESRWLSDIQNSIINLKITKSDIIHFITTKLLRVV